MAIFKKLEQPKPTVTAPRAPPKPAAPPPPPKAAPAKAPLSEGQQTTVNKQTGRTSSFEAFRPPSVSIPETSQGWGDCSKGRNNGRGTPDDSIGTGDASSGRNRGTPDDSIGVGDTAWGRNRGTPDDSIGVGGPSHGRNRGTPDDSIGTGDASSGRNRGTPDDSIGGGMAPRGRVPIDDEIGARRAPTDPTSLARAGLPATTSAKMDALLSPPTSRRAVEASFVFSQQSFADLPAADRTKLVDMMTVGGDRACRATAEIFQQSDGALFNNVAKDGTRLIDSLDTMARSPSGQKVLNDCLYDICAPGRIWQGRAPTCTVSSMQYELASQQPSEYARLLAGLSTTGQVTMRGGGVLSMNAESAISAAIELADGRSTSEALFQSAAMEYANGADNYNLEAQESRSTERENPTYKGLYPDQIRTMVGQLFGATYETKEIGTDAEATAELNEIMSRERPNRPVLFDIDMGDFNHCVSLEKIEPDRVVYRDPTTGQLESLTQQEFRERLVAVHYAPLPRPEDIERPIGKFPGGKNKMLFV